CAGPVLEVAKPERAPVIAAVGDIACSVSDEDDEGEGGTGSACHMQTTSDLVVDRGFAAILALGDLQYESGKLSDFEQSYDRTWGRVKAITHPVPGNHEYGTRGAAGYFSYFGPAAGDPGRGYYSFDVGAWHLIALNSNCQRVGGCAPGSPQEEWLRADLAAHPTRCTLAYWHHPRFSSGQHGNNEQVDALWQDLYRAGAEIVLAGHDHDYERLAPMDAQGNRDDARGIREFVVGTGGKNHYGFERILPTSEVRNADAFGVLTLTLHPTGYEWKFVAEPGSSFSDAGSGVCH
ncbi:MAG: metallophosphoesterase, partial [Thermomicrobiaceae bacterium]|nr:metallophosphoesterase [Thermomicrobiaceae bacterium]